MKKKNEKINEFEKEQDLVNEETGLETDENFDAKEAEEFEKKIEEEIEKDSKKSKEDDVFIGSSVEMFLNDLKQYPLLTLEQEKALTKKLKSTKPGDKENAKKRLLLCNMRLVVYAAKKYRGRGVDFEDLISEGYIGLSKGIDRFDYRKGFKLSTFVLYWIKQSMSRAIDDQGRTVRLPVHVNDKLSKYKKIKNQLTNQLGYEPSTETIAKKMKMSEKALEELINTSKDTLSLDKYVGEEEDVTMEDLIADDKNISPEEYANKSDIRKRLEEALNTLKPKEKCIVELRHGFNDDVPRTLEDIGKLMNITRERVRQIETIAYKKLRVRAKDLESLVA